MSKTNIKNNPLDLARQSHQDAMQNLANAQEDLTRHQQTREDLAQTIRQTGKAPSGQSLADIDNTITETELRISGLQSQLETAADHLATATADDV